MKRRQAIRNLVIITSAAALLPGCRSESGPNANNELVLTSEQRQLVGQFAEALLPRGKSGVTTPEPTTDFILAVLKDCHSPADHQQYLVGLSELQAFVKQKYKADFGSIGTEKQAEVFTYLTASTGVSEPLKFFYEKTRSLTIEHFTTSEFFMKNITGWEFAPGRFVGCAAA